MRKIPTIYDNQAADFLKETKTDFDIQYLGLALHFPEDTEARHVYSVVLRTKRGFYRFDFGDSIANTEKNAKLPIDQYEKPSAYTVLACLDPFYPETFRDFCAEFGYDEDSINARRTFEGCRAEAEGLARIFTPEDLEKLAEIQ